MKSKFNYRLHGLTKYKSTTTILVAYLNSLPPGSFPLSGRCHSLRFSKAFDLGPHELLLRKFDDFGLSPVYVAWFHSYPTNRLTNVRYCGAISTPYEVLSGVTQGSGLGPRRISIFTNDLGSAVKYKYCLLFADDVQIFREIKSPYDN